MYIAYLSSFRYLPAWQVALFTVFTPVAVWAVHELYAGSLNLTRALPVTLAVGGAGWLSFREFDGSASLSGFILVQISNLCFAWGQIHYRFTVRRHLLNAQDERSLFGILYLAGTALTAMAASLQVNWGQAMETLAATPTTLAALIYSGLVASGLAFFLWNRGAARAAPSTLAVLNNLKAPLAIAVSLLVFGEQADIPRLTLALLILGLGAATSTWIERQPHGKSR
jgi:drug/metabolite transporter (DMT)-like permease